MIEWNQNPTLATTRQSLYHGQPRTQQQQNQLQRSILKSKSSSKVSGGGRGSAALGDIEENFGQSGIDCNDDIGDDGSKSTAPIEDTNQSFTVGNQEGELDNDDEEEEIIFYKSSLTIQKEESVANHDNEDGADDCTDGDDDDDDYERAKRAIAATSSCSHGYSRSPSSKSSRRRRNSIEGCDAADEDISNQLRYRISSSAEPLASSTIHCSVHFEKTQGDDAFD